jgi:hypothetical protein
MAARPAWDAILLDSTLPTALIRHVEGLEAEVRVAAVEAYRAKVVGSGGDPPRPLAKAERATCDQCLAEARKWVAINVIDW